MTDENTNETLTRRDVLGMIKDHSERAVKPVLEQLEKLQASIQSPKPKDTVPQDEVSRKYDEMKSQNEILLKRINAQEERAKADNLELTMNRVLAEHNVQHAEHAKAYLKGAGLVKYNNAGELVLIGADGADYPFAMGMKDWVKTDTAKLYLAPKNTNGSGTNPQKTSSNTPVRPTGQLSAEQVDQYNDQILSDAIARQFGR